MHHYNKKIERAIQVARFLSKKEKIMKKVLGKMRRAIEDYHMIDAGETICVAVSGGKDSMLLLNALATYRNFSPIPFELHAISLDLGFKNTDYGKIAAYCESLDVPFALKETRIGEIVFERREEKNPCALCSNLKRGALHNLALELGSKKVALGHHADDLVETFLMSLLYEGRIQSFKAVTFLDRKGITVIRPLIYLREQEIIYAVNQEKIPVVKSNCPADGNTKREEMKQLVRELSQKIPKSDERMILAVKKYMDEQQSQE